MAFRYPRIPRSLFSSPFFRHFLKEKKISWLAQLEVINKMAMWQPKRWMTAVVNYILLDVYIDRVAVCESGASHRVEHNSVVSRIQEG